MGTVGSNPTLSSPLTGRASVTLDPVWLGRNGGLHRYLRQLKFFKLTAAVRRPPLIQGRNQVGLYILCSPSPLFQKNNGEVAERLKAHAWKACVGLYPTVGSNPTLSATPSQEGGLADPLPRVGTC